MSYYKDTKGEVYFFNTLDDRTKYGSADLVPMSDSDAAAFIAGVNAGDEKKPLTRFSPRDYLKRFTMTEYAAARSGPIQVQYALDNLIGAQFVDLADPDVAAGLDAMVAAGIIDATRKAELLQPA